MDEKEIIELVRTISSDASIKLIEVAVLECIQVLSGFLLCTIMSFVFWISRRRISDAMDEFPGGIILSAIFGFMAFVCLLFLVPMSISTLFMPEATGLQILLNKI